MEIKTGLQEKTLNILKSFIPRNDDDAIDVQPIIKKIKPRKRGLIESSEPEVELLEDEPKLLSFADFNNIDLD